MTRIFLLASVVAVSGCSNLYAPDVTRFTEPEVISTHDVRPPGAAADSCWAEARNGAHVRAPSTLGNGQPVWFERPCDAEMTMYFIETLQRALQVRGLYRREVTGKMDTATRFAVRLYQQPLGLDSDILSLSAARSLGLSNVVIEGAKHEATDRAQS